MIAFGDRMLVREGAVNPKWTAVWVAAVAGCLGAWGLVGLALFR
jgi:hypothetical protein